MPQRRAKEKRLSVRHISIFYLIAAVDFTLKSTTLLPATERREKGEARLVDGRSTFEVVDFLRNDKWTEEFQSRERTTNRGCVAVHM